MRPSPRRHEPGDFSRAKVAPSCQLSLICQRRAVGNAGLCVVVSFLFRIATPCLSARGIWYLVGGRQKLQRHWRLPPLISAVVLPIKSSRPICTRSSCVKNARNVANAMRPLPNRRRKSVLFVTELLQSPGNGHANERQPRRNRSRSKIDSPCQPRMNTGLHGLCFLSSRHGESPT